MANVAHSTLTGSNLHEPKGITTATNGQVYVANGSGTGFWTDISATSFTGTVADFATPVAPTGWLECDGTDVSKITFPALFTALTIQVTGTRTSGGAVVSVTSGNTSNMRPGYFVYGLVAGQFVSGTTIVSVDNSTQFTMSAGASSNGSATVVVSPWLLNTNTIRLPNVSAAARYRRSRSSTVHMGVSQTDLLKNHTHTGTGTSGGASVNHVHAYSGTTDDENQGHTHTSTGNELGPGGGGAGLVSGALEFATHPTSLPNVGHTHTYGGNTGLQNQDHSHTTTITTGVPDSSLGGSETRPISLVLMTCIKT